MPADAITNLEVWQHKWPIQIMQWRSNSILYSAVFVYAIILLFDVLVNSWLSRVSTLHWTIGKLCGATEIDRALKYGQIYRLEFETDVKIGFADPENGGLYLLISRDNFVESESVAGV